MLTLVVLILVDSVIPNVVPVHTNTKRKYLQIDTCICWCVLCTCTCVCVLVKCAIRIRLTNVCCWHFSGFMLFPFSFCYSLPNFLFLCVCFFCVALLLSLFSHERKKDYIFIVSAWMANDNVIKGLTSDPILCLCFWQIFCGCTCMVLYICMYYKCHILFWWFYTFYCILLDHTIHIRIQCNRHCGRVGKWNQTETEPSNEKKECKIHTTQFHSVFFWFFITHFSHFIPILCCELYRAEFSRKKMAIVGLSVIFFGRKNIRKEIVIIIE